MKNIILGLAITATTLTFCNSNNSMESRNRIKDPQTKLQKNNASETASSLAVTLNTVSLKEIISAYLQMKNAFTEDNSIGAAAPGRKLETAFNNFDKSSLTPAQKKTYEDVEADAREHAEHIGANGGNIEHQREHFEFLSKDIYDLVTYSEVGRFYIKILIQCLIKGKALFG